MKKLIIVAVISMLSVRCSKPQIEPAPYVQEQIRGTKWISSGTFYYGVGMSAHRTLEFDEGGSDTAGIGTYTLTDYYTSSVMYQTGMKWKLNRVNLTIYYTEFRSNSDSIFAVWLDGALYSGYFYKKVK